MLKHALLAVAVIAVTFAVGLEGAAALKTLLAPALALIH
jgi:hypothetical protein